MDADIIASVRRMVEGRFPELADVEPSASSVNEKISVLTFKKEFKTEDGAHISHVVKVTVDRSGNILKVTSSK